MNSAFARVPALIKGVRLRADERPGWVLQTNERVAMRLSDRAAAAISLIDGVRSIADIANALRQRYQGGIDTFDADVLVLTRVLLGRGFLMLRTPAVAAAGAR